MLELERSEHPIRQAVRAEPIEHRTGRVTAPSFMVRILDMVAQ